MPRLFFSSTKAAGPQLSTNFRAGARPLRFCVLAGAALVAVACGTRSKPPGYAGDDARDFVVKNRAELQAEIAAGSGPRIYDLAIIANCQDVPALSRGLHKHHDDFFLPDGSAPPGANDSAEVADRVVRFMADRREFRCLNLDLSRTSEMSAGLRHIGPRRGPTTNRGGTP